MLSKPRILTLVVSAVLAMMLVPGIALAEEGDLVAGGANLTVQASNPYPQYNYYNSASDYQISCTWYAWNQAYSRLGIALPAWGNGGQWYDNARASGYSVGSTPRANSLAVYNGYDAWGHVEFVTAVNGNSITVNSGGYNPTTPPGTIDGLVKSGVVGQNHLVGFIYLDITYSQKPSNVKVALEKTVFYAGEHTTFYCSGDDVSYFYVTVYDSSGGVVESQRVAPGGHCTGYYGAGSYTATVEGTNNCGTTYGAEVKFAVKDVRPSNVKVVLEKTVFYAGEHTTFYCSGDDVSYFYVTVYDSSGGVVESQRVAPGGHCTGYYGAGSYTATVEGTNNCGTTYGPDVKFTVKDGSPPIDLSSSTVITIADQQYSGKALIPVPTVKLESTTLKAGTDYTVSYTNNVNAGKATVTVTGKGNYVGEVTGSFTIQQAAQSEPAAQPEQTMQPTDSSTSPSSETLPTAPGGSPSDSGASQTTDPATSLAPSPESPGTVMHRLYNPYSGEHFYTSDDEEFAGLVEIGWADEGMGWMAPAWSSAPVFRMYNPYAGEHHYTMDAGEKDSMVQAGWADEGIGWYSDPSESVPLYREYNPNEPANNHNYTSSREEHDGLVALGWRDEGVAWYGV